MGESIIKAVLNMLIPLTILIYPLCCLKTRPPFGDAFSYRTSRAMKSREAWEYAQPVFGRLGTRVYLILTGITLIVNAANVIFKLDGNVVMMCLLSALQVADMFALFVVMAAVERKLKRAFPED